MSIDDIIYAPIRKVVYRVQGKKIAHGHWWNLSEIVEWDVAVSVKERYEECKPTGIFEFRIVSWEKD
jgi:hypothetical protein